MPLLARVPSLRLSALAVATVALVGRALAKCAAPAGDAGPTPVALRVDVLRLQVAEETGFFTDTLKGDVRYEVEARDSRSDAVLGRFAADGHAQEDYVSDTKAHAEQ